MFVALAPACCFRLFQELHDLFSAMFSRPLKTHRGKDRAHLELADLFGPDELMDDFVTQVKQSVADVALIVF